MSEEIGKRVGDYQILSELGAGGMGQVYRVRNVISDRIEAMKVLLPNLSGQQELAARFQREIKLMASLNHPNIAQLRTAFTANNQLVMVMEYVDGTNLAERLEHGPLPVPEALDYTDQVLNALSYAHQQGIIHRDVKPSNMMVTPQGLVKLMDFGIARGNQDRSLTTTGSTLGSLSYMSPEQVKGEATDARSDLYSVGVSLYEMVTGQRPFQSGSDYSIMSAHVKEAPKPPIELQPSLPPALNEIILMAIAKDPALRFKNADAFRNALSSVRAGLPSAPVAPTPARPDVAVTATSLQTPTPTATPTPVPAMPAASTTPLSSPTPVPAPAAPSVISMPPPPPPASHRGLYMTLGALLVVVVLVGAGIYVPRWSKTHATSSPQAPAVPATASGTDASAPAASQPAADTMQPVAPATPPANAAPDAASASSAAAAATSSVPPPNPLQDKVPLAATREVESSAPAPAKSSGKMAKHAAVANSMAAPASQAASAPPQSPAPDNSADLDSVEHDVDQLANRAAAVNSSLDRMQQQQAASGYGLRGDMVSRQASMKNNLAKAEEAVQHGDLERAKKFEKLAEGDVEVLEHFLGR